MRCCLRLPRTSLFVLVVCVGCAGCATKRTITIIPHPPDATISIDDKPVGTGQITKTIEFKDDKATHRVSASRRGYQEAAIDLTKGYGSNELVMNLKPFTRVVNILVRPAPAVVKVDGQPITDKPVSAISKRLQFTVDENDNWTKYLVSAERPGFTVAQTTVSWTDTRAPVYTLTMEPIKKDLSVTTTPPGAQVTLDEQPLGTSPVRTVGQSFSFDTESNQFVARKLTASLPGYDPVSIPVAWDDGKDQYHIELVPKTKTVHINTDPPGATVTIDGQELPRDNAGNSVATLQFPPVNRKGDLRTYTAVVKKKTEATEWHPKEITLAWDNGQPDYEVALKEIRTVPMNLLAMEMVRNADGAWEAQPKSNSTIAAKDTTEGKRESPIRITSRLPKGASIDSLAVSPDGKRVLFTVFAAGETNRAGDLRSQIYVVKTDGGGGMELITDGKSLDITPSYSPGGDQILFASNRAGRRLSIWSMPSNGAPGITSLTSDEGNNLWPSMDSDPKPRLFYQSMVDTRPDPRIFSTQVGTSFRTDLSNQGGTQPRVNPKNDAVLFASVNEKTGKRDLFRMSDKGGLAENLTNTPDLDETDGAWNGDGTKIIFASDRGVDEDKRANYDIWMLDLTKGGSPIQITTNPSYDDRPVWDPSGNAIYFRSNRGGEWGIWKVNIAR
jgi:TolB protein